ncbi:NAD(P)-dependent oxidoreductase [Tumebacillus permanentifrigoris]|uniref:3-hydroxyisobutyrate dehydrogenase n=1 Tax=Tumebacillus permanentifrigoris TaxID=378543 RepID=A0A316DZM8_9BACL|nr:NAD(P)-dependent oxidoreductase [Tumebacillus permanentifrigoris]PWK16000.1 3-hydroxyisobutyrate dehydrogenase [Tumebacillus permanentifrigoris]
MTLKLGWIGLGNMGQPMVTRLLQAGFDVTVYNRTRAKAEAFVEQGAKVANSPQELAEQVDTVITMVADGATLEEVLYGESGVIHGVRAGQTVIDMSTVGPEPVRFAAEAFLQRGVKFLEAPVSGSVGPAKEGTLVILVGGEEQAYEQHKPVFDVLGKASFHFGESGQGAQAKLAINLLLGVVLQGLSEALVLGSKAGLDRETLLRAIGVTACAAPIVLGKTPSILAGEYPAAFSLKHMEKDFGLALDEAKKVEAALPATSAAHQTYVAAKANGLGDQDIMAVLAHLERMSGLK